MWAYNFLLIDAETWLLIHVLEKVYLFFWSLQSVLAAHQVTAEPCHFGPCQLWKSPAPAVLALRSWLNSFKQAIWHKFQLLVSLCGQATSPKGVIYILGFLWSVPRGRQHVTKMLGLEPLPPTKTERGRTEQNCSLKLVSLGWNYLGFFFLMFRKKRHRKLKPSGKCQGAVV